MLHFDALGFASRRGFTEIFLAPGAGIRYLTGVFEAELAPFIVARRSAFGSGINAEKPLGVAGCTGREKLRGGKLPEAIEGRGEAGTVVL
eukprot:237536-Rhodomonas_salina.1